MAADDLKDAMARIDSAISGTPDAADAGAQRIETNGSGDSLEDAMARIESAPVVDDAPSQEPAPRTPLTSLQSLYLGGHQAASNVGGGLESLGELGVSALGPGGRSDALRRLGRGIREDQNAEADAYGPQTNLTDIKSPGSFLQWAKETLFSQIPQMAPSIVTGALGALAGTLTGPLAPVAVPALGALGAALPNILMETGQVKQNVEDAAPGEQAPLSELIGGTAAGLLDTVVPFKIGRALVSRFGVKAGGEIAGSLMKRVGIGALKDMSYEGVTEAAQQAIEEYAAAQGTGTDIKPGLPLRMTEAGAAGALLGAAGGAVEGGASKKAPEKTPPPGGPTPPGPDGGTGGPPGPSGSTVAPKIAPPPGFELMVDELGAPKEFGNVKTGETLPLDYKSVKLSPGETKKTAAVPGETVDVTRETKAPVSATETPPGAGVQPVSDSPSGTGGPLLPAVPGGVPEGVAGQIGPETTQAAESSKGTAIPGNQGGVDVGTAAAGQPLQPAGPADQAILGDGTRANPVRLAQPDHIEPARQIVDTEPTEAQKKAGNYQKGHLRLHGLNITIENPRGSVRSGVGADGKPWQASMPADYGYIKGTEGSDGDQVDVYVGPNPQSDRAFVIDQRVAETGRHDEHKTFLGFDDRAQVRDAYRQSFSDGKADQRNGGIREMSVDEFKTRLDAGEFKKALSGPRSALTLPDEHQAETTQIDTAAQQDVTAGLPPTTPEGIEAVKAAEQAGPQPLTLETARAALETNIDPVTGEKPKGNKALREFRARMKAEINRIQDETPMAPEVRAHLDANIAAQDAYDAAHPEEITPPSNGNKDLEGEKATEEITPPQPPAVDKKPKTEAEETRRKPLPKMQDVGETMAGKRSWAAAKLEKTEGDKGIEKLLEMTRDATDFGDVLASDSTSGAKVYANAIRQQFKPFLEGFGSSLGGGRKRWQTDFTTRVKQTWEQNPQRVKDAAADFIGRMETLRHALSGAKTTAEMHAAMRGALLDPDGKATGTTELSSALDRHARHYFWTRNLGLRNETLPAHQFRDDAELPTRKTPLIRPGIRVEDIQRQNQPDHRKGRDVTAQEFKDTFGFRGVEFGEWVTGGEGRAHVNAAFEGLLDFAHAIGVPPKALSLGGRLGLAFGSRGQGRAAAHFEPSNDVINLTKTKGDGTVAHEWGHALDYALRKIPGTEALRRSINDALSRTWDVAAATRQLDNLIKGDSFISGQRKLGPVATAKRFVDDLWSRPGWGAQTRTDFKHEAWELDNHAKDGYWAKPEELWARSFEAFVYDEMLAGDKTSPYIVNDWVETGKTSKESGYRGKPYPDGSERQNFNEMWRSVLSQLKWTDDGTLAGTKFEALPSSRDAVEEALKKVDIEARWAELQKEKRDGRKPGDVHPIGEGSPSGEPSGVVGDGESGPETGTGDGSGGTDRGSGERGAGTGKSRTGEESGNADSEAEDGAGHGGVGSDAGDTSDGRGKRERDRAKRGVRGQNYRIGPDEDIASGSPRVRAANNVKAIELALELERGDQAATPDQQKSLARYVGWGGLPNVFNEKRYEFHDVRSRLKELLSPSQYESARASVINAHYTSQPVVRSVWHGLTELGFGEGSVLEPGMGTGNFIGMSPEGANNRFTGVELDDVTGKIARLLYPEAAIHIQGFETLPVAANTFDAVIGNVPFADVKPSDKEYNKSRKLNLHNYFIVKALNLLKPGGVMGVVTSRYSMDSQTSDARETMSKIGDLIGAIRLPDTAFRDNAGTEVVTDILFFRKRKAGETAKDTASWLPVKQIDVEGTKVWINTYFADHPEMVLGKHSTRGTMYASDSYTVSGSSKDINASIREAVAKIKANAEKNNLLFDAEEGGTENYDDLGAPPEHIKDGALYVKDGKILQRHGVGAVPANVKPADQARVKALIGLRDEARATLAAQRETWDGKGAEPWSVPQKALNLGYDAFVKSYGPINKAKVTKRTLPSGEERIYRSYPNMVGFRVDPDSFLVMAIERADEEADTYTKAAIMTSRVLEPAKVITRADTPDEALIASLNAKGGVNLSYMAKLLGQDAKDVAKALAGRIFNDPQSGKWQTTEVYLSGDVRAKLAVAKMAARRDKDQYQANVDALEAVQPEDLKPSQISVRLGAPWVPTSDVDDFVSQLLETRAVSKYLPKDSVWSLDLASSRTVANETTWGTRDADGYRLVLDALNQKQTKIVYTDAEGKTHTNTDATILAQEKQKAIQEEFEKWLWRDTARGQRLARRYNDNYNNERNTEYDGSHLSLPGSSATIKLRTTQLKAVWRFLVAGNTLLDHVVGAGKTFAAVAAGAEGKRLGLLKKPLFAVPNHMLEQFSREYLQLYPGADIIVADKENFQGDTRRRFVARVAAENWDAVVMTHSSFELVSMSSAFQADFIRADIAEYENMIRAARGDRATVKELEKSKKRRESKLKELLAAKNKDRGVTFQEMGVDSLFVDEAHLFKNLEFSTKTQGVQVPSSQRAFDLYLKTRYIDSVTPGHGLMFMTGTPIANSVSEMFTMQRYLDPRGLSQRGLSHFDGWASTFGEMVTKPELSPDGQSARLKTRFASFRNIPELVSMYRKFSDLVTRDDLLRTGQIVLPKVQGGKAEVVEIEASPELIAYVKNLAVRAEAVRRKDVKPDEDNMLKISGDGRKAALDMRLVESGSKAIANRKAAKVAQNVFDIWKSTKSRRLTQLVFLDLSTPKKAGEGYSVYNDIRSELLARGVPENETAFIHGADTDEKKARLFKDVREGRVRVLMGSTEKMGVGTNVQDRLIALHNVDAPWRPSDLEQREGRIVRQGNKNEEVRILNYVTVGSFDAYTWQGLERKARFINQIKKGDPSVRIAEDIDEQALSYAEIKALASGNPIIMEKAKIDADVDRLGRTRRAHFDQQQAIGWDIAAVPARLEAAEQRLAGYESDAKKMKMPDAGKYDARFGASTYTVRKDAAAALGNLIFALHQKVVKSVPDGEKNAKPAAETQKIGEFAGFPISIFADGVHNPSIVVSRTNKEEEVEAPLATLESGGALTRLENEIRKFPGDVEATKESIASLKKRLADLKAQAGKPFDKEEEYQKAVRRRDEIDAALQTPADTKTPADRGPMASERSDTLDRVDEEGQKVSTELLVGDTTRGTMIRYSDAFAPQREAVTKEVRARLDKLGLNHVGVVIGDRLASVTDGKLRMISGIQYVDRSGDGLKAMIGVALDAEQGVHWTVNHEAIHAFRGYGLFTEEEWGVLTSHAKQWRGEYDIEARYKGLREEVKDEEAVAEAFAEWATAPSTRSTLGKIFHRLWNALLAIGGSFHDSGFADVDQIFSRIESGEIGDRDSPEQGSPRFPSYSERSDAERFSLRGMATSDIGRIVKEMVKGVKPGPNVEVVRRRSPSDVPLWKQYLYTPEAVFRRYSPRFYQVWQATARLMDLKDKAVSRFQKDYTAAMGRLGPAQVEDVSALLFLGDAENTEFGPEELARGYAEEDGVKTWLIGENRVPDKATVSAYQDMRKLVSKLGRFVDQHERKMQARLRTRKFALIKTLARMRQMNEPEFRTLMEKALGLRSKLRRAEFSTASGESQDELVSALSAAETEIYGRLRDGESETAEAEAARFADRYQELAGIETRLQNTSVQRIKGYVPHQFIGSWAVYRVLQEEDANGETVDAYHLIPADQTGFHPDSEAAIRAANAYATQNPDENLVVKPVEFRFAGQNGGTTLTDKSYGKFVGDVMQSFELDPKEAGDLVSEVARRRGRRRFAGFKQRRKGVEGYAKDLNTVFERHIGQVSRYVTMDEAKYMAVAATEAEGLGPAKANQDRPVLAKMIESWFRDLNGEKQPIEKYFDAMFDNRPWSIPATALGAGLTAFGAAGGLTGNPLLGALVGSYVGYRFYGAMSKGGDFKTRSVTGAMTNDMAHLKLGAVFNVFSAVVNLSQIPINTFPVLGAKFTGIGMERYMAAMTKGRGAKDVEPEKWTQAHKDYLTLGRANIKPAAKYTEGAENLFEKESRLAAASLFLFNQAEQMNRGVTFLGALARAEAGGAQRGAAMRSAERATSRTQFNYSNVNKPELLRNVLLRVPLQFKNFMAQQIAFMAGLDRKELPRFLFALGLTAGVLGLPFLDLLDELTKWLFGTENSVIAAIKERALQAQADGDVPGWMIDFLVRGAPSLAGVDISSRVGMGDKFLPTQFRDFEGPWFSTLSQARALGEANGTAIDYIRNLSSGLGGPLKALENAAGGYPLVETALQPGGVEKLSKAMSDGRAMVLNPYLRGRPEYAPTAAENVLTALGGTTLRQAKLRDFSEIAKNETAAYNKKTRKAVDAVTRGLVTGDTDKARDAIVDSARSGTPITPGQVKKAIKEQAIPRAGRAIENAPRALRPGLMKLYNAVEQKDVKALDKVSDAGVSWTQGDAVGAARAAGLPVTAALLAKIDNPTRDKLLVRFTMSG